ncbi:unnamed protein product, partial [Discosporangium mesarthrocarpum]
PVLAEVRSASRVYSRACLERGQRYWDYENFQLSSLEWEDVERFEVTRRLGCGRFSEVVEAITTDTEQRVVLKVLKPVKLSRVKREIRVLQASPSMNIVKLEGVCRDPVSGTITLVLEHLGDEAQWLGHMTMSGRHGQPRGHTAWQGQGQGQGQSTQAKGCGGMLTDREVRYYLYKLLQALDFCHSQGIMHRDVKPLNVIINRRTGCLRLIDWGLGDFYIPGERGRAGKRVG